MAKRSDDSPVVMEWDTKVWMFTNSLILKQLFGALGASLLIVWIILLLATGFDPEMIAVFFDLVLVFLLICGLAFVAMAIMGGYYYAHNTLKEKSFICENQQRQTILLKILTTIGFIGGMSSGKYGLAGSSALAASRLKQEMWWEDVTSLTYEPKRRYIYVKTGLLEPLAIFCNADNYAEVEAFVREHTQPYLDKREAAKKAKAEKKAAEKKKASEKKKDSEIKTEAEKKKEAEIKTEADIKNDADKKEGAELKEDAENTMNVENKQ